MIDKRPLLIAECADAADVVAAVGFAREHGLPRRRPRRRAQRPGARQRRRRAGDRPVGDARRARRPGERARCGSGPAAPPATSTTPPTPTGSRCRSASSRPPGSPASRSAAAWGTSVRKHGLTIDNLLEADVVLADGRMVTASPTSNADLFWGLRGGGGNFGVVTSFLFQAHPVSQVYAGPVFWDFEHARAVMQRLPRVPAERTRGARRLRRAEDGARRRPVPGRAPGQARLRGHRLLQRPGRARRRRSWRRLLDGLPAPLFNWMGEMPYPGDAGAVRPAAAEGPAVVLARRLRPRR